MSPTNPSHFLLFPSPGWGHVRPLCTLTTRLVQEKENVVVTLIVAPYLLVKTRTELSHQFLGESWESSEALQRIRILSLSPSKSIGVDPDPVDAYRLAYQALYEAKPITCSETDTTFDAVPTPCAVIIDFFSFPQLRATRAVSGHSVPIIACVAAGAAAIVRLFGPESMGGIGDTSARISAEIARTGLPDDEIGVKIYNHTEGKLVQVPGLPAMYDYEFFTQVTADPFILKLLLGAYSMLRESDASIVTTSYDYDSVALDAMKRWFSDMQKESYVLGPVLPIGFGTETRSTEEGASVDIETFLGEMLLKHGKRSVFFISFGTIFWPGVPEYIDELIEALIEKKVPFLLSHASPHAKISEQQAERVKSSGLGMLTPWSPQQSVLNHSATGWFVTHGGFNSVIESLGSGIPLICWPFAGDQPVAAAHVTENLHVAFELFQIRLGVSLKPIARNGVNPEGTREAVGIEIRQTIDLCLGEKGQELRSNAEKLKVKFAKAWDEDGISRREMRRFLHTYI